MCYFDLKDLSKYDGTQTSEEHDGEKPIYIAVDGLVFDVTEGADFYGPCTSRRAAARPAYTCSSHGSSRAAAVRRRVAARRSPAGTSALAND